MGLDMNELQENILKVIQSIVQTDGLYKNFSTNSPWKEKKIINHSAIRYGILNYVAKFSLANDTYLITEKCKKNLKEAGLITKGKLLRKHKGKKNKFTFEHPVPSNVIADLILFDPNDEKRIKNILLKTNLVTVLTYEENSLLNKSLVANMPNNWSYDSGDFFARYKKSALEIPSERIEVHGAIKR